MAIVSGRPGVDGLSEAVGVLREWQNDGAPMQLHPGDLGSSSAVVCTPSSNVGAVATYKSAGFQQGPEVRDQYREAQDMYRK
ncbi:MULTISPECIES: hypothetical protein [unclassified Streptomyces]|uniref:hypothetical protein n=1 Tax=unclassified Streptomyces TaxID=2593676 RepID=UPI0035DC9BEA